MGHRNTLKKKQKAFKARHSTKGSIKAANKGRIDHESGPAKKHIMSKQERQNQKSQLKSTKKVQLAERSKIFEGRNGVPRNVAIIPLTSDIDSLAVAQHISKSLDGNEEGNGIVHVPKFRQRLRLYVPRFSQFFELLDAARSADFVLFVLSATQEITDYGEQIMRCITLQGVSTCHGLIWNMNGKSKKEEGDVKSSLTSWFNHFFPAEKLYSLDNTTEMLNIGRLVCQKSPRGVSWRDDRGYVVLENINFVENQPNALVVEGALRGKSLSPEQYMHLHGYGDFSVAKIEVLNDPVIYEASSDKTMNLLVDDEDQVELSDDDDEIEGERTGIRIDGQTSVNQIIEAGLEEDVTRAKNVPAGTSDYQAAWFIEGEDYRSDSDDEEGVLTDEEGELAPKTEPVDNGDKMDEDNDMDMDYSAEDIAAYKGGEYTAKDDLMFPDEIELDPRVSGKDRLRRYRGVSSLRHVNWNPLEIDDHMPSEFTKLYRPGNLFATKNRIQKQLDSGAQPGERVRVYLIGIGDFSSKVVETQSLINNGTSQTIYGLLPGEEKLGYVNASISMDSEVQHSIKSKSQVVVQYGPRRVLANPIFSQGQHSDNNVHKFNRYFHPGRAAVATFIAPVALMNNAPVVYYRTSFENEQVLLGSGSILDSDANRVIVKQVILTGLPVKIHRKLITVRHMFFNRDDVLWFREVPLYTKMGAQGFIKESLGTHGLFKATFDKKIMSADTICLPLYKRQWPKVASPAPF